MSRLNIGNIESGYTHDGCFHADDVIATVLLLSLNPKIIIHRVNSVSDEIQLNPKNIVYDIGLGEFDHHQANRRINDFGYPYSAFGLLWEEFGREYLIKKGFVRIEDAFSRFKEEIVSKIDQGDNCGYNDIVGFRENYAIKQFNANWYEIKADEKIQDDQFGKAVQYATLVFDNWIRKLYERIEMPDKEKIIFNDAMKNSEDGIVVLSENIPWREYISEGNNAVKIVISKNLRGGYNVSSVDSSQIKITDNQYLSFVHPSKFMGVADTLAYAISAAQKILNIDKVPKSQLIL